MNAIRNQMNRFVQRSSKHFQDSTRSRVPTGGRRRRTRENVHMSTVAGIAVGRFALLSVATLPFTTWLAIFTYDYYHRVEICQEQLSTPHDPPHTKRGKLVGRDRELAEVNKLLSNKPNQILVIAGGNESGKSRFIGEVLQSISSSKKDRGVTYVQLAALVDTVSSFTNVLVHAFQLRWLYLRHSLIDVLPFAGSEILVMKERFGDRDLEQALDVTTKALTLYDKKQPKYKPVIIIDGLGEGAADWMRTPEGKLCAQRFLLWCIYVTKERQLAHIVLTGNEQLVLSLTDQNRITRGHVKVIGLEDLSYEDATKIIQGELKTATTKEIDLIISKFGGFIHDIRGVSRDIQYRLDHKDEESMTLKHRASIVQEVLEARFQQQVERVFAAFAQSREEGDEVKTGGDSGDEEEMDPYLDPLKSIYSEAQVRQEMKEKMEEEDDDGDSSWTRLQLWKTLQVLVSSPDKSVPFSELRDDVFDGDKDPILELMQEDVLGFQVDRSSDGGWNWKVTPATPAIGKAFEHLVNDSNVTERFREEERAEERKEQIQEIEEQRLQLRKQRISLDYRKRSLMKTIELGKQLGKDENVRETFSKVFDGIVREETAQEQEYQRLRRKRDLLSHQSSIVGQLSEGRGHSISSTDSASIKALLKDSLLKQGVVSSSKLNAAFNEADEDNDRVITAVEFQKLIKSTTGKDVSLDDAHTLLKEWDVNGDRKLDYSEFLQMILSDSGKKS